MWYQLLQQKNIKKIVASFSTRVPKWIFWSRLKFLTGIDFRLQPQGSIFRMQVIKGDMKEIAITKPCNIWHGKICTPVNRYMSLLYAEYANHYIQIFLKIYIIGWKHYVNFSYSISTTLKRRGAGRFFSTRPYLMTLFFQFSASGTKKSLKFSVF